MAIDMGVTERKKKEENTDPRAKIKITYGTDSGTYTYNPSEGTVKIAEPEYQDSSYSYDPGTTNPEPSYDEPVSEPTQEVVKPPEPNYDSVETTTDTTTGESWQDEKKTETDNKAKESEPIVYTGGSLGKTSTGTGTTTTANSGTSTTQSISSDQWDSEAWKKAFEAGVRHGNTDKNAGTKSGTATTTTAATTPKTPTTTGTTTPTTGTGNGTTTGVTTPGTQGTTTVNGMTQEEAEAWIDKEKERLATEGKGSLPDVMPVTIPSPEEAKEKARERDREEAAKSTFVYEPPQLYSDSYKTPQDWWTATGGFDKPFEYYDSQKDEYVKMVPDGKGGYDVYTSPVSSTVTRDAKTGLLENSTPNWELDQSYRVYVPNTRIGGDTGTAAGSTTTTTGKGATTTVTTNTGSTTKGNSTGTTTTGVTTTSGNTTGSTATTTTGSTKADDRLAFKNEQAEAADRNTGTNTGTTNTESTKPPSGSTYFTPSYGQDMEKGVKAPYRTEGYTEEELNAYGNKPRSDWKYYNGKVAYEGYYLAPNGKYYPVDQTKYEYWKRNGGSYKGWEEGMRDYWNNFGTFYGYNKRKTSYGGGGGGYRYYGGSGNYYSGSGSSGSSNNSNGLYWNPNTSWSI